MKYIFLFWSPQVSFLKLLPIILLALIQPLFTSAEVVDKIVAVVNDDVITLSELEEETTQLYQLMANPDAGIPLEITAKKMREITLNKIIDQRIISQRAKELDITVTDEDVDKAYDIMRRRISPDPAKFKKALAKSGLTEAVYKKRLRSQVLQSKLLSYDVSSKTAITKEMLLKYYNEDYSAKLTGKGYHLLQMGFNWDTDTKDSKKLAENKRNAHKVAERVVEMVKEGQDFKALAKKISNLPSARDGGDIGTFSLDEMATTTRDAIVPLNPGELSAIIETSVGYQIFKLVAEKENTPKSIAPYAAIKKEIRQELHRVKLEEAQLAWIKKLRDSAYINIL